MSANPDLVCSRIYPPASLPQWRSAYGRRHSIDPRPRLRDPGPVSAVPSLRRSAPWSAPLQGIRQDRLPRDTLLSSYTPPLPFRQGIPMRPMQAVARFDEGLGTDVSPAARLFTTFYNLHCLPGCQLRRASHLTDTEHPPHA